MDLAAAMIHPIPNSGYRKWSGLARLAGLGDVHPPQRQGPVGPGLHLLGEAVEEGFHCLDTPVGDRRDAHAVDSRGARVGGNADPCSPHHVTTGELVVEGMEAAFGVLLGAAVQHALERLELVHTLVPSDGASPKGTRLLRAFGCGRLI
jgi:hypothetical protein